MVPMDENYGSYDYNLNIPRYIDSQNRRYSRYFLAHLKSSLKYFGNIENLNAYWRVYPNFKR
jgi:hypothetical protein